MFGDGLVMFENGVLFVLDVDMFFGDVNCVYFFYLEIFKVLEFGYWFLFDDGKIQFCVIEVSLIKVVIEVIVGGKLLDCKGVSVFDLEIVISVMIEKDYKDLIVVLD